MCTDSSFGPHQVLIHRWEMEVKPSVIASRAAQAITLKGETVRAVHKYSRYPVQLSQESRPQTQQHSTTVSDTAGSGRPAGAPLRARAPGGRGARPPGPRQRRAPRASSARTRRLCAHVPIARASRRNSSRGNFVRASQSMNGEPGSVTSQASARSNRWPFSASTLRALGRRLKSQIANCYCARRCTLHTRDTRGVVAS